MDSEKTTLLLVDDDRTILSVFQRALEQRGYRVLLAEHGNAALALFEQTVPDVVFLDVLMPEKEGLETLLEMRRRFPQVPVYVMSGGGATGKHDFLSVAKKFGAAGTLPKPILAATLIGIIEEIRQRTRMINQRTA